MITLKDFMEVVNYRITEGGDNHCSVYGDNQYSLSSWNGDQDGWSLEIVFDTKTQTVYQVEAHDYSYKRAYRRINPYYHNEYMKLDSDYRNNAWDEVKFTDLETDEDWLEKAQAIVNREEYDTRVKVPIDLPDEDMFALMKRAHDQDVTLNDYINRVLQEACEKGMNENSN